MSEKVSIVTLGCSKNLVDSEVITGFIKEGGFVLTDALEEAWAIIVNTCSFINEAKEESIETILELVRYKEEGRCKRLIVAGCLPQRYKSELPVEMPEVDYFVGTGELSKIPEILKDSIKERVLVNNPDYLYDSTTPRVLSSSAGSAYVKIGEGCSNHCSYCAIPLIRGDFRSREESSIVDEVIALADKGVKEINLIAQDTTSYGRDRDDLTLEGLLKKLVKISGIEWIRLLYLHPLRVNKRLLGLMRDEEKICKYIDIPLQHINDEILKAMNRGIDKDGIRRLIDSIRETLPEAVVRTTFIVGFPGECDEVFEELLEFVKEVEFDRLGAFTYSNEEDTPSFKMREQVKERVKKRRYRRLMSLQKKISLKKNRCLIGSISRGIVEGISEESSYILQGRIEGQAPDVDGITYITRGEAKSGEIVSLLITEAGDYDLVAEIQS